MDYGVYAIFVFDLGKRAFAFDVESLVSSSGHVKTFLPRLFNISKLPPNLFLNLVNVHLSHFTNTRPSIPQINRSFLPVLNFKISFRLAINLIYLQLPLLSIRFVTRLKNDLFLLKVIILNYWCPCGCKGIVF